MEIDLTLCTWCHCPEKEHQDWYSGRACPKQLLSHLTVYEQMDNFDLMKFYEKSNHS